MLPSPTKKKKLREGKKEFINQQQNRKEKKNNGKLPFIPNLYFGRYENPNRWP